MDTARLRRQLNVIDWDFQQPLRGVVGGVHWYPASFPPSVPSSLITLLSPAGGTVFDPYGGTGAVGAEAIRQGRRAVICDINPIAVLASWSVLALLNLRLHDPTVFENTVMFVHDWLAARTAISKGQERLRLMAAEPPTLDSQLAKWLRPSPATVWARMIVGQGSWASLTRWYEAGTLDEIRSLAKSINRLDSFALKCFLITGLSAVMRSASSQNQSWGHIADNVFPKTRIKKDVLLQLRRWWTLATNSVTNGDKVTGNRGAAEKSSVLHVDWTTAKQSAAKSIPPCDLLLTSPPYSNAIDYFRAQRLSLYLLGHDEGAVDALAVGEIGARRKRFRPNSTELWAEELQAALEIQLSLVKRDGFVCLILPHKRHPHADHIEDLLASHFKDGWEPLADIERTIHQFRTRQSWTSIRKESITVFRRR